MVNRRPEQTRRRIAQTASRLHSLARPAAVPAGGLLVSERTDRITYDEAQRLRYRPAEIGEAFGPQWATYWFRLAATVPAAWAGRPGELRRGRGGPGGLGRAAGRARLGQRLRGAAVPRRRARARARQGRRLRPHDRAAR